MGKFVYRARTADGRVVKGVLRAASEERAIALLNSHNLSPIEVTVGDTDSIWNRDVLGGVGMRQLILFFRQTASMISAGVPVLQALQALRKQVPQMTFGRLLEDMMYDVESGESLSIAMSKHSVVFTPFMLGVVRTGEASGRLSQSLLSIADYLEQDYNFTRKVRAALIYPVFVLTVVVILSIVMFTFVLPQLISVFADAGVQLPWPTRLLIGLTNFFRSYWILLLILAVTVAAMGRSYLRTNEGRFTVSTWALRLPVINRLFQKIYLARLTSVLHTLFTSDVPALESLQLAREAMGNRVYQRILDDTISSVKDGAAISFVWQQEPYIPAMLTTMVSVGERSGEIGTAFAEASRFFRRDVDVILESMAVLLEPILILILAVGVGIVVGAVLLPIYNLVLVL